MYTIGVDLGGSNLRVGIISNTGEIIKRVAVETNAHNGPDYVISEMNKLIQTLQTDFSVRGIGIGSPGPLDPFRGIVLEPPNLPGWHSVPLVQRIEELTGLPVFLDNDANVAALAEARIGAGAEANSVFYMTVSTGIGGGYVLDGRIVQGAQGNCGEIGNMIVDPSKKGANGLNNGALEALASGTAIGKEALELHGIRGGAVEVFRLAQAGDKRAKQTIDDAVFYLAVGMANIIHTINPEVFVLGGGVMKSKVLFFDDLKEKVKSLVYPSLRDSLIIKEATLGQSAGLIGAGLLAHSSLSKEGSR